MREYLTIFESNLNHYAQLSSDDLRAHARAVEGENSTGALTSEDADWSFNPAFPVSKLVGLMPGGVQGWKQWMADELAMNDEDDLGREWADLMDTDVHEPVIIGLPDIVPAEIWDGWHRVAATIAKGISTIPAIVGVPKGMVTEDDGDNLSDYKEGLCYGLALELNDQMGWQLAVIAGEDEDAALGIWSMHAFVIMPDGDGFDIEGPRSPEAILREYASPDEDFWVQTVDRAQFVALLGDSVVQMNHQNRARTKDVVNTYLRSTYPDEFAMRTEGFTAWP